MMMPSLSNKIHIYPQKTRPFCDETWWKIEPSSFSQSNRNNQEKAKEHSSTSIQELEVSSVYISNRLASHLIEILQQYRIRKLVFRMCQVRTRILRDILDQCRPEELEHLTLHRVHNVDHECVHLITSKLLGIKSLSIHHKSSSGTDFSYLLSRVHQLPNLMVLRFDGSLVEDDNVAGLLHSLQVPGGLPTLNALSLKSCNLSDAAIASIISTITADENRLPNLARLDLSINRCYEGGMEALGRLLSAHWCRLEQLDISCQLPRTEQSLPVHLLCHGLKGNRSLKFLRLSGNAIRDTSLLGQTLALNKGLESLDWCGNSLNCEGLQILTRSLAQNRTLRFLNIKSNRLTSLDGLDLSANYTLCRLSHSSRGPEAYAIDNICHLNSIGRRLVRENPQYTGIWPHLFRRCNQNVDDINYFVQNAQFLHAPAVTIETDSNPASMIV